MGGWHPREPRPDVVLIAGKFAAAGMQRSTLPARNLRATGPRDSAPTFKTGILTKSRLTPKAPSSPDRDDRVRRRPFSQAYRMEPPLPAFLQS